MPSNKKAAGKAAFFIGRKPCRKNRKNRISQTPGQFLRYVLTMMNAAIAGATPAYLTFTKTIWNVTGRH